MKLQKRRKIGDYYPLYDGHGSIIALSDSDGEITDTYDYTPNGKIRNLTGTTINPYQYSGERTDAETGFQYLRARYYNFETGRFTTRDTWAGVDGNPITLNKYLYGNGNPVRYVDPSGQMSLSGIMAAQMVSNVLLNVAMPMMTNYFSGFIGGLTGIDDTFWRLIPDAIIVGGNISLKYFTFGIEILKNTRNLGARVYFFAGLTSSKNFDKSVYTGYAFNSLDGDVDNYSGRSIVFSPRLSKSLFGKDLDKYKLGASVFGSPSIFEGKLATNGINIGRGDLDSISGAILYYRKLNGVIGEINTGVGDTISFFNNILDSTFENSQKWLDWYYTGGD